MTSAELRSLFLRYFEDLGHTLVASSPLVPANDPTLLFTNAGMVQFKDVFLGREERSYLRAVSAQRCVRAGGKHNDLENVGYTGRHHTFFEMLGNFSFGDYFKREAIQYAWIFLTETLKLPPERLWVTVYDQDQEAADVWLKEMGIDPARFTRIGTKDNFWSMGDTGPCGPCSEIFYDHGPGIPGGPPGSPDEEGDRYVEIWNLVFMQYDRAADGTLTPLPKPSVDTGMGLERIAAVTQGVHSNYDIDLFRNLLRAAAELVGLGHTDHASLRVIADHIRSCAFLITDGVVPSNEGRGYVLRRILRRAIRHGYKLGLREPFFHKLVGPLCGEMGGAYPELVKARNHVEKVLHREEERFFETIENGMLLLERHLGIPITTGTPGAEPTRRRETVEGGERLSGETAGKPIFPGDIAFMLYDTYGFPLDLTADVCREHGVIVDEAGFHAAMARQREQSRAASQFSVGYEHGLEIEGGCEFTGYEHLQEQTHILGLWRDGHPTETLHAGEEATVVLERTPFYGESGGQVGDTGKIIVGEAVFEVSDTQKQSTGLHLHKGRLLLGVLHVGDPCQAVVDAAKRQATALNHSATHLLHAALRRVLGPHVTQKGSLVNADRLRFDFAHDTPMTADELARVEKLVNEQIRHNAEVRADIMARDEAMALGAMALFGEKYGEEVRVLRIGDFSTELCGGTHVERAGDIGFFKILGESGVAAGIRRIEAVTGQSAVERAEESDRLIQLLSERLKVSRDGLHEKTQQLLERNRQLEKELERLKAKVASAAGSDLAAQAIEIDGIRLLVARVDEADPKTLRDLVDQLKNKLGHGAIVLAAVREGKVNLIAGVTQELSTRLKAGDLVNCVAVQVGGKGGGRPDLAQAGGNEPAHLDAALRTVPEWVRQRLA